MSGEVKNVLIVGIDEQGIVLSTDILSQVLVSAEYEVKTAETHGIGQRRDSLNAMIRFGDKVYSPVIERGKADYMIAFEQLEALRWSDYLKPGGTLIINTERIKPLTVLLGEDEYPEEIESAIFQRDVKLLVISASDITEKAGNKGATELVLLGCLAAIMPIAKDIWYACIKRRIFPRTADIDKEAFDLGYELIASPEMVI